MSPFIVLLDMDGTIIGNISPQVCEWELISQLCPGKLKQYKDNLKTHLENGLMRPQFISFIDYIKEANQNVEVYIYTASDTKWAHVIVPCIEQVIGFKFNRPLFTRSHCIMRGTDIRKSFNNVLPIVYSKLKNTYLLASADELRPNTHMIDNFHEVLANSLDERRLLKCPTYSYTSFYDVLRLIDESVLREHYQAISKNLTSYKLFPYVSNSTPFSYEVFKALYFEILGTNVKNSIKSNSQPDMYWQTLTGFLAKSDNLPLKDSMIKYINQRINK